MGEWNMSFPEDSIPHIASSNYATSAYALNANHTATGGLATLVDTTNTMTTAGQWFDVQPTENLVLRRHISPQVATKPKPVIMDMPEKTTSRFVRVIIVDPNENLSLEDRLVYKGDEKFTDLNDQELFFELDIKTLLASHNEKRVKTVDKSVKERTQYLEAAKIRDLKMVVVNIATF